jgi:hypothetical protein
MSDTATSLDNVQDLLQIRPTLNAPLLASYYQLGFTCTKIAKITGYTHQHISRKTKDLEKYIFPMLKGNAYAAFMQKYMSMRYTEEAEHVLDTCGMNGKKEFKAGHVLQLNTAASQCIDKSRLYDGESTQNVSMEVNNANINETSRAIREAEARLKKLTGEVIDV